MSDPHGSVGRRGFLTAAGASVGAVALATTPSTAAAAGAQSADRREELAVVHESGYRQIDPHRYRYRSERDLVAAVYDRPVARDHDGRIVGRLATDFSVDGATGRLAVTIWDDATFQTGDDLTPDDVAYSLRRLTTDSVGPTGSTAD